MTDDEIVAALREAMESSARGNTYAQWAAHILPTVRRIAEQHAAEPDAEELLRERVARTIQARLAYRRVVVRDLEAREVADEVIAVMRGNR